MIVKENLLYKKQDIPPKTTAGTPEERDKEILAGAREFFVNSLPTPDEKSLEFTEPGELLELYIKMMDEEPTLDGFRRILLSQLSYNPSKEAQYRELEAMTPGDMRADKRLAGEFKKFLLEKLPRDLLKERAARYSKEKGYAVEEDDVADEMSIDDLLAIHDKRPFHTIAGFHASKKDLEEAQIERSRFPSTVVVNGEKTEVPAGYAHYNLNPEALYKGNLSPGGPNYLYIVEGSSADRENDISRSQKTASGVKQWQISASPLHIRAKIELTPAVIEAMGLGFE